MIPKTIRAMEPHTRQRFHFAASSFSRMFGVDKVTPEMIDFCAGWAEQTMPPPLEGLNEVDSYFRRLWDLRLSYN
jgi:phosphoenolpyruvate carboxylase